MPKFYVLIIALCLTGCGSMFASYSPKKLPDACLNQPYEQTLISEKGGVADFAFFSSDPDFKFIPSEKLFLHYDENNNAQYWEIHTKTTLVGTPKSLDPIKIKVHFALYKSMGIHLRDEYSQSFTLKVKDCG